MTLTISFDRNRNIGSRAVIHNGGCIYKQKWGLTPRYAETRAPALVYPRRWSTKWVSITCDGIRP